MTKLLKFVSPLFLASAAPCLAQTVPPPAAQTQPAAKPALQADRMICVKEDDTGSRLSAHKICRTQSQWDELKRDDRSAVERAQTQRAMSAPGK